MVLCLSAIKRELTIVKQAIAAEKQKEKQLYSKMFS